MPEYYQAPVPERTATQFQQGDTLDLHKSELESVEQIRARADAARVAESAMRYSTIERQPVYDERTIIAMVGRNILSCRQSELDLAA